MSNMSKVIVEGRAGTFTHQVTAGENGEHHFLIDEPRNFGGENKGPNPYDYLLAALGGCTSMTMFVYAKLKGIPLEEVKVELIENRIHAKDCMDCESPQGYVHEIHRVITLDGPLTLEQRQKLLEIAAHCPLHKTLINEIKIRDTLAGASQNTPE